MDKEELLKEILISKEQDELTDRALDLIIRVVDSTSKRYLPRWQLSEEEEIEVKFNALEQCMNRSLNFKDPVKMTNAYSYIVQIIRCSFAYTITKIKKEKDGTSCKK